MFRHPTSLVKKLHSSQKGMTGLETAIILIAFVTVAAVLSYSVLTAGIFSSERSKETIYTGLEQAQGTLEVKGGVYGYSSDNATLTSIRIKIGLVDPNEEVDKASIIASYFDDTISHQLTSSDFTLSKLAGSLEQGSTNMIERDEVWEMVVTIPVAANVGPHDWMVVQIIPPKGATIHVKRTMPGALDPYFSLN